MRRHLLSLVVPGLAGLAACGDDPESTETVTIHAEGAAYLAVRDEGGDWRELVPAADVELEVSGPFTTASVCDGDGSFNFYTIHASPEDRDSGWLDVRCVAPEIDEVEVTVSPEQLGTLYISNRRTFAGSPLIVEAGIHDVIAIDAKSTPPRVAIARGVDLTADATVFVDLATDGVAMIEATVAADTTEVYGTAILTTESGTRAYGPWTFTAGQAWLFPPALVVSTDTQRISANAAAGAGSRAASKVIAGNETTIELTLPAGLSSGTRTVEGVPAFAWDTTDTWDERYGYLANADYTVLYDVMALPGYVAATGVDDTLTLADPAELPGWDPTWAITGAATLDWGLTMFGTLGEQSQSATLDLVLTDAQR